MAIIDIIIIAALGAFIFLRLRSELGNKSGTEHLPPAANRQRQNEGRDVDPYGRPMDTQQDDDSVVELEGDPALRRVFQDIRRADRSFNVPQFLSGAEGAYRMILEAFWSGDSATLKEFLSEDISGQFIGAIDARADAGHTLDNRLLDIENAKVIEGRLDNKSAELTVQFTSEILAVTRDSDGRVIEGDASDAVTVNDQWTFARDVSSRDPKWILVATRAG
ncbi:Tim44/TimA family putative adaptor protein [Kordiimonas sp. SCSIO 12610]|uniref:Tim44/TimA family putative adaptor protein n=1 Tax=Kordiimonas sp. SCSIO 12610 TaxID=2829597 RepID=UPI00210EC27F|nr:Tim44/TimA family putative adaptor protein [Kordiimonas sp. SCSIO 12610]UTW55442.1 Tim44 domain-containing protein [Kordiimonas sp. SCSIO 12610]